MRTNYLNLKFLPVVLLLLSIVGLASLAGCNNSNEQLLNAIKAKDVAKVRELLGGDIELEPGDGPHAVTKPLAYAAAYGNLEIVELLVSKGADLNGIVAYGDVPLIKAHEHNNYDIVKFFILNEADVNLPNEFGVTPFIGLCSDSNLELVKLAHENGGEIDKLFANKVNGNGELNFNAIQAAVAYGQEEVTKYLIAEGADVSVKDAKDRTLIEIAESEGHSKIVGLLKTIRETDEDQN